MRHGPQAACHDGGSGLACAKTRRSVWRRQWRSGLSCLFALLFNHKRLPIVWKSSVSAQAAQPPPARKQPEAAHRGKPFAALKVAGSRAYGGSGRGCARTRGAAQRRRGGRWGKKNRNAGVPVSSIHLRTQHKGRTVCTPAAFAAGWPHRMAAAGRKKDKWTPRHTNAIPLRLSRPAKR